MSVVKLASLFLLGIALGWCYYHLGVKALAWQLTNEIENELMNHGTQ